MHAVNSLGRFKSTPHDNKLSSPYKNSIASTSKGTEVTKSHVALLDIEQFKKTSGLVREHYSLPRYTKGREACHQVFGKTNFDMALEQKKINV